MLYVHLEANEPELVHVHLSWSFMAVKRSPVDEKARSSLVHVAFRLF